ncbi:MAG TPA: anthrone oxygenase family protein, partial [Puia sp.]|nr:anthrone oxygenase family protein [Puia sp.]
LASGILFANIYTSLVDAKSWGASMPKSIEAAREYFKVVNAARFFRTFAPINMVVGLLALILFWNDPVNIRAYLGIALIFYAMGDVLTFAYFYPRNRIMFLTTPIPDTETLRKAWKGWTTMNWVRSLIFFVGIGFSFLALYTIYISK